MCKVLINGTSQSECKNVGGRRFIVCCEGKRKWDGISKYDERTHERKTTNAVNHKEKLLWRKYE